MLFVVGSWSLSVVVFFGCVVFLTCCLLCRWLFVAVCCALFVDYCLWFVDVCAFVGCCSLCVACYLLSGACRMLFCGLAACSL